MTPKEKAEQLYYWYQNLLMPFFKDKDLLKSRVKKCCLICIDEMIESHKEWQTEQGEWLEHYLEVKSEIEKL